MTLFTSTRDSSVCKIKVSDLLLNVLLDIIISEKSGMNEPVWIISPWISDISFSFIGRSTLSGIFPTPKKSMKLSEILKMLLNHGGKLKIVCRPPHDLISIDNLRILRFLEEANFPRKDLIIYRVVDDILSQKSTIDFLYNLLPYIEARAVEFRFNEKLHAKILVSRNCAIVGSSNMTISGVYFNLEFNCFMTDTEEVTKIKRFCNEIWEQSFDPASYVHQCADFRALLNNLEYIKDRFDPGLRDLYDELKTLKDKVTTMKNKF